MARRLALGVADTGSWPAPVEWFDSQCIPRLAEVATLAYSIPPRWRGYCMQYEYFPPGFPPLCPRPHHLSPKSPLPHQLRGIPGAVHVPKLSRSHPQAPSHPSTSRQTCHYERRVSSALLSVARPPRHPRQSSRGASRAMTLRLTTSRLDTYLVRRWVVIPRLSCREKGL